LDDRQQGHQSDIDEELGTADAGQQEPAGQAVGVIHRQYRGDKHVADRSAHARRYEQWSPAVSVHGQRERHARHYDEQSEHYGAGVRRQLRVGQHRRRVRFHHASAARHLQHGQRKYDDQRYTVPVEQVCQLSLAPVKRTPP